MSSSSQSAGAAARKDIKQKSVPMSDRNQTQGQARTVVRSVAVLDAIRTSLLHPQLASILQNLFSGWGAPTLPLGADSLMSLFAGAIVLSASVNVPLEASGAFWRKVVELSANGDIAETMPIPEEALGSMVREWYDQKFEAAMRYKNLKHSIGVWSGMSVDDEFYDPSALGDVQQELQEHLLDHPDCALPWPSPDQVNNMLATGEWGEDKSHGWVDFVGDVVKYFNVHTREYAPYAPMACLCEPCATGVHFKATVANYRHARARTLAAAYNANGGAGIGKTMVPPHSSLVHPEREDLEHEERQVLEQTTTRLRVAGEIMKMHAAFTGLTTADSLKVLAHMIQQDDDDGALTPAEKTFLEQHFPKQPKPGAIVERKHVQWLSRLRPERWISTPALPYGPLGEGDIAPAWAHPLAWIGLPGPVSTGYFGHETTVLGTEQLLHKLGQVEALYGPAYHTGDMHMASAAALQAKLGSYCSSTSSASVSGGSAGAATGSTSTATALTAAPFPVVLPAVLSTATDVLYSVADASCSLPVAVYKQSLDKAGQVAGGAATGAASAKATKGTAVKGKSKAGGAAAKGSDPAAPVALDQSAMHAALQDAAAAFGEAHGLDPWKYLPPPINNGDAMPQAPWMSFLGPHEGWKPSLSPASQALVQSLETARQEQLVEGAALVERLVQLNYSGRVLPNRKLPGSCAMLPEGICTNRPMTVNPVAERLSLEDIIVPVAPVATANPLAFLTTVHTTVSIMVALGILPRDAAIPTGPGDKTLSTPLTFALRHVWGMRLLGANELSASDVQARMAAFYTIYSCLGQSTAIRYIAESADPSCAIPYPEVTEAGLLCGHDFNRSSTFLPHDWLKAMMHKAEGWSIGGSAAVAAAGAGISATSSAAAGAGPSAPPALEWRPLDIVARLVRGNSAAHIPGSAGYDLEGSLMTLGKGQVVPSDGNTGYTPYPHYVHMPAGLRLGTGLGYMPSKTLGIINVAKEDGKPSPAELHARALFDHFSPTTTRITLVPDYMGYLMPQALELAKAHSDKYAVHARQDGLLVLVGMDVMESRVVPCHAKYGTWRSQDGKGDVPVPDLPGPASGLLSLATWTTTDYSNLLARKYKLYRERIALGLEIGDNRIAAGLRPDFPPARPDPLDLARQAIEAREAKEAAAQAQGQDKGDAAGAAGGKAAATGKAKADPKGKKTAAPAAGGTAADGEDAAGGDKRRSGRLAQVEEDKAKSKPAPAPKPNKPLSMPGIISIDRRQAGPEMTGEVALLRKDGSQLKRSKAKWPFRTFSLFDGHLHGGAWPAIVSYEPLAGPHVYCPWSRHPWLTNPTAFRAFGDHQIKGLQPVDGKGLRTDKVLAGVPAAARSAALPVALTSLPDGYSVRPETRDEGWFLASLCRDTATGLVTWDKDIGGSTGTGAGSTAALPVGQDYYRSVYGLVTNGEGTVVAVDGQAGRQPLDSDDDEEDKDEEEELSGAAAAAGGKKAPSKRRLLARRIHVPWVPSSVLECIPAPPYDVDLSALGTFSKDGKEGKIMAAKQKEWEKEAAERAKAEASPSAAGAGAGSSAAEPAPTTSSAIPGGSPSRPTAIPTTTLAETPGGAHGAAMLLEALGKLTISDLPADKKLQLPAYTTVHEDGTGLGRTIRGELRMGKGKEAGQPWVDKAAEAMAKALGNTSIVLDPAQTQAARELSSSFHHRSLLVNLGQTEREGPAERALNMARLASQLGLGLTNTAKGSPKTLSMVAKLFPWQAMTDMAAGRVAAVPAGLDTRAYSTMLDIQWDAVPGGWTDDEAKKAVILIEEALQASGKGPRFDGSDVDTATAASPGAGQAGKVPSTPPGQIPDPALDPAGYLTFITTPAHATVVPKGGVTTDVDTARDYDEQQYPSASEEEDGGKGSDNSDEDEDDEMDEDNEDHGAAASAAGPGSTNALGRVRRAASTKASKALRAGAKGENSNCNEDEDEDMEAEPAAAMPKKAAGKAKGAPGAAGKGAAASVALATKSNLAPAKATTGGGDEEEDMAEDEAGASAVGAASKAKAPAKTPATGTKEPGGNGSGAGAGASSSKATEPPPLLSASGRPRRAAAMGPKTYVAPPLNLSDDEHSHDGAQGKAKGKSKGKKGRGRAVSSSDEDEGGRRSDGDFSMSSGHESSDDSSDHSSFMIAEDEASDVEAEEPSSESSVGDDGFERGAGASRRGRKAGGASNGSGSRARSQAASRSAAGGAGAITISSGAKKWVPSAHYNGDDSTTCTLPECGHVKHARLDLLKPGCWEAHMQEHHPEVYGQIQDGQPVCRYCGKDWRLASTQDPAHKDFLRTFGWHEQAHLDWFTCPDTTCAFACNLKRNMDAHIRLYHTGEAKRVPCERGCGKDFTGKHDMLRHVAQVHDGVRHTCPECGREFTVKVHMDNHVQKEHRGRMFGCPHCSHVCGVRGEMNKHISKYHAKEDQATSRKAITVHYPGEDGKYSRK